MNAVKEDIEKLVQKELESANSKFPMFASNHEGYAVIKEEVEESKEQLKYIEDFLQYAWNGIKSNSKNYSLQHIETVKERAIDLACEAIQVAAMAQKFIDSAEKGIARLKSIL